MSRLGSKSEGFEYPESGEYRTLAMSGPVVVNNSDAYNAACLAGLGLIQAPEIGVREHLARGALVEVLPRYRPEPMSLSLLYAHRRNLPKHVRVFMDCSPTDVESWRSHRELRHQVCGIAKWNPVSHQSKLRNWNSSSFSDSDKRRNWCLTSSASPP